LQNWKNKMKEFNELDELFKEGLQNAHIASSAGVWGTVASSVSTASTATVTAAAWIVAAKLVVGSIVAVSVSYFAYHAITNNQKEVAPKEKITSEKIAEKISESKSLPAEKPKTIDIEKPIVKTNKPEYYRLPIGSNEEEIAHENGGNLPIGSGIIPSNLPTTPVVRNNQPQPESPAVKQTPNNPVSVSTCTHTLSIVATKLAEGMYSLGVAGANGDVFWNFDDGNGYAVKGETAIFNIPTGKSGEIKLKALCRLKNGCKDSAGFILNVDAGTPEVWDFLTPNGDGYNDVYLPLFQAPPAYFDMAIYDANNHTVFHSDNATLGWNGISGAIQCHAGRYLMVLVYKSNASSKSRTIRKTIELIR